VKVTVTFPPDFRVATGESGDRARVFSNEAAARKYAEHMAGFGQWCQLETRRRPKALWALVATYEPRKGGRFRVVDPYADNSVTRLEEAVLGSLIPSRRIT
jgi:hypothetical protein